MRLDFLHVWWNCDKLVKFWKEVNDEGTSTINRQGYVTVRFRI